MNMFVIPNGVIDSSYAIKDCFTGCLNALLSQQCREQQKVIPEKVD
jgi:hypothetical protein